MNQGKFVFSQVMEFIPRYQFDKIVNSYNHLLHLLFGQLTGCDLLGTSACALRPIPRCFIILASVRA